MNPVQPNPNVNYFARTNFRNQSRVFGIKTDDRRRHLYVIGKTGMGKSTMLENMVVQDVKAGHGLALVDPHGDAVEKMLNFIPTHRVNDVVYLNAADFEHPLAFNVLEAVIPEHRHLVASGLISVFKKIWIDSWGPRLEYVLRNAILALLEYPGSTLLGVTRILVDRKYRDKVITKLTDPIVRAFWVDEFNAYSNQFRTEAISPIQNKVGQFLSSSIIRNIVGQPKSTIDMRDIMDHGKILLLNLAKGRIGEDNSALLGAMLITKIQIAAMSRIDVPETRRRDFFLYVDEFQNFATESFATILSEARKYRLDLVIAHQYIEQLDEKVQAAVFGNVGTIVCFRVGAGDAEFLAKEFEPIFTETDLVNLTKYDIYLKLMIDGVASEPFSATTIPPISAPEGNADTVIRVSRERYSHPKNVIEDKIWRWTGAEAQAVADQKVEEGRRGTPPRPSQVEGGPSKPPPSSLEPVAYIPKETPISLAEALQRTPATFGKSYPAGRETPERSARDEHGPRGVRRRPRHDHGRRPNPSSPSPPGREPAAPAHPPARNEPSPPAPPDPSPDSEPRPLQPGQVIRLDERR